MLKLAVLVSGGGTNLQAIMDGIASGSITNAKIVTVISNNKNAYALTRAEQAGIPAMCISPKDYADREAFHEALLKALVESEVDLIVLAGCLVVIPEMIIDRFPNRIINIHPSLIPSFCGTEYTGPIILQKAVEVLPDDTPKSLQQRVMEQAEWVIMPKAIDLIANGKVKVQDGKVLIEQ